MHQLHTDNINEGISTGTFDDGSQQLTAQGE